MDITALRLSGQVMEVEFCTKKEQTLIKIFLRSVLGDGLSWNLDEVESSWTVEMICKDWLAERQSIRIAIYNPMRVCLW